MMNLKYSIFVSPFQSLFCVTCRRNPQILKQSLKIYYLTLNFPVNFISHYDVLQSLCSYQISMHLCKLFWYSPQFMLFFPMSINHIFSFPYKRLLSFSYYHLALLKFFRYILISKDNNFFLWTFLKLIVHNTHKVLNVL